MIAVDWWMVIFSPTFPSRYTHMVLAAYLTTAPVVDAVSAFQRLKRLGLAERGSRFAWRSACSRWWPR